MSSFTGLAIPTHPKPHRLAARLHRRVDRALDQAWVPASDLGFYGRYFPALALGVRKKVEALIDMLKLVEGWSDEREMLLARSIASDLARA